MNSGPYCPALSDNFTSSFAAFTFISYLLQDPGVLSVFRLMLFGQTLGHLRDGWVWEPEQRVDLGGDRHKL